MKYIHELHNIILNGVANIPIFSKDLSLLIEDYAPHLENKSQQILSLFALISTRNKLAWQLQSKQPLLLNIPFAEAAYLAPLSQEAKNILMNIFNEKEEEILTEFIKKFNYKKWAFPSIYYASLLNFGLKKQNLVHWINNILGEKGVWLSQKNKNWNYAFQAYQNAKEPSSLPRLKTISTEQLFYIKEHIYYDSVQELWSINLPEEISSQLKACQIKNNIYKNFNNNSNNYLIQLLKILDPKHWVVGQENTVEYFIKLLKAAQKQNMYTYKAILLGLQKAATLYQNKELIIAQYLFLLEDTKLWYEDINNIVGNTTLLTDEEMEQIALLYYDNLIHNIPYADNHPIIDFLMKWEIWSVEVSVKILQLFSNEYRTSQQFNYGFSIIKKRAGYYVPYSLQERLQNFVMNNEDMSSNATVQEFMHIVNTRTALAKFYL